MNGMAGWTAGPWRLRFDFAYEASSGVAVEDLAKVESLVPCQLWSSEAERGLEKNECHACDTGYTKGRKQFKMIINKSAEPALG